MNLADPGELRRFLSKHGIGAEKALGQHFLCSDSVVSAIVDQVADLAGILEIGPGPGVLTSQLASWDRQLIALELDRRMIPALAESAPYADVRNLDALQADFPALLNEMPNPRGIVGNLPYYITGSLLDRIAGARDHFSVAVLMMQKEVADRISAPPMHADRGSLSVYLQSCFAIDTIIQAPPSAFDPPPKVKSTVLALVPRTREPIPEPVCKFIRAGFTQPRKTLANNLTSALKLERERVAEAIAVVGLRSDARPHMLSEEDWRRLAAQLSPENLAN